MVESISCESIIAEALSAKFFKDNPHLIDRPSIYRWVSLALKRFGTNIMQKRPKIIHVNNYKADLGYDFGILSMALWCEPESYFIKNGQKDTLLKTYYWKERIEASGIAGNECRDACYTAPENKCIVEKYYFHDGGEVLTYYKNPRYVKLGKDIIRDRCVGDCVNKYNYDEQYAINIKGQTLYANFKEGTIYLEYYQLPVDDEGLPLIPVTENGFLESYIEHLIKRRVLEDALLSDDAPNKITLYREFKADEREFLSLALTETSAFNMKELWKAINKKRIDTLKYDLALQ